MGVRVLTVIGTRPEAIKLFPVVKALDADSRFDTRVCVTGQHGAMVDEILAAAGIAAPAGPVVLRPGQPLDALFSRAIEVIGSAIDAFAPDWVLVQGDTATAMAGAFAAYHRHVRVCHVEAGLRTGHLHSPWPEEGYRRAISALAALHCTPTVRARDALLAEGIPPGAIHVTGNTVVDAVRWFGSSLSDAPDRADRAARLSAWCGDRRLITVTCHRRETLGAPLDGIVDALARIARRRDCALVCVLHPNPDLRAPFHAKLGGMSNVTLEPPLGYPDFIRLLSLSHVVLSDSGGVQEEVCEFDTTLLVLRDHTERPEAVATGAMRLIGRAPEAICAAVDEVLSVPRRMKRDGGANPYGDGRAAGRIVDALAAAPAEAESGIAQNHAIA